MKQIQTRSRHGNPAPYLVSTVILLVLAVTACRNPFWDNDDGSAHLNATGSVEIFIGTLSPMTLMPDFPAITTYDITLTRAGYTPVVYAGELSASKTIDNLAVGQWNVTVVGKDAATTAVASGTEPVEVLTSGTASVTVTLEYFAAQGQGDLEIDIVFPDIVGVDTVSYVKTPMGGSAEEPYYLSITDDTGADSSVHIAESSIDAGSYTVIINFERSSVTIATVVETAHVYGNLSTSPDGDPEITLLEGDFDSAPPAPVSFSVVDNEDNSAGLSWVAADIYTETNFVIERHVTSDFSDASPAEIIVSANVESYDNSGIAGDTEWYFRVKSRNAFGDSAWVEYATPVVVQCVHVGNYSITSVAGLVTFNTNGFTKVSGYLYVGGFTDSGSFTDLSLLENLREVGGILMVYSSSSLESLHGLENLTTVGGNINLNWLESLTDTSALAVSGSVTGISISYNAVLPSLDGLEGITTCTGGLTIENNADLNDLSGLAYLTAIDGDVTILNNDNEEFTTLGELASLETVGGFVRIEGNAGLQDVGLDALETIDGYLEIDDNDAMTQIDLPALTRVGDGDNDDDFRVYRNDALTAFGDLGNLLTVHGSFNVGTDSGYSNLPNPQIFDCTGLSNLATVGQGVYIGNETQLQSLSGLSSLSTVATELRLYNNAHLNQMTLPALSTVGGSLNISSNGASAGTSDGVVSLPALTSVGTGFACSYNANIESLTVGTENTTACEIETGFTVEQNGQLETIAADGITSIGGDVSVLTNAVLSTLSANDLETVNGYFSIANNYQLSAVSASALQTVGGYFTLDDADQLTGLSGFPVLTSVGGDLNIAYNGNLQQISGMGILSAVGGHVCIRENYKLNSVTGLTSLSTVGTSLYYSNNGGSASGTGTFSLPGLTQVGTDIDVNYNGGLSSITIGTEDTTLVVGASSSGYVSIVGNTGSSTIVLNGIETIPSNLNLGYTQNLESVSAPDLVTVTGSLGFNYASYPGLSSLSMPVLTTVGGYLDLTDTQLDDLSGLASLQTIAGDLLVQTNATLDTLFGGGGQLASVGGYLHIYNNDELDDLVGLSNLESVVEHLSIERNDVLKSIAALSTLDTIGREDGGNRGLYLYLNPALESLTGLEELDTIGGNLEINNNDGPLFVTLAPLAELDAAGVGNDLIITGNAALETFTGLDGLSGAFPGNISISANPVLQNSGGNTGIEALDAITTIAGDLYVYDNDMLEEFDFDALTSVGGDLTISGHWMLSGIDSLVGLTDIGGTLTIGGNNMLTSLGDGSTTGFCDLASIGGGLAITSNPNLQEIDGLGNASLTVIGSVEAAEGTGAPLTITNNDSLDSLAGLSTITEVRGTLTISDNDDPAFTDLYDLAALESVNGGIQIYLNSKLTDLFGTSGSLGDVGTGYFYVTWLGSDVYSIAVDNNAVLASIDGITGAMTSYPAVTSGALSTAIDRVAIVANPLLTDLDGLANLQVLQDHLNIRGNALLTDISGLNNLTTVQQTISIYGNQKLVQFPEVGSLTSIAGELEIYQNGYYTDAEDKALVVDFGFDALTTVGGELDVRYNSCDNTSYADNAAVITHFTDNAEWVGTGSTNITSNNFYEP